jgi:hypothetical protein
MLLFSARIVRGCEPRERSHSSLRSARETAGHLRPSPAPVVAVVAALAGRVAPARTSRAVRSETDAIKNLLNEKNTTKCSPEPVVFFLARVDRQNPKNNTRPASFGRVLYQTRDRSICGGGATRERARDSPLVGELPA